MPRGQHTSKRPSGSQQRKAAREKSKSLQKIAKSMYKYLIKPSQEGGQGSLTDTTAPTTSRAHAHSPTDASGASNADEQAMEVGVRAMSDSEQSEKSDSESDVDGESEKIADDTDSSHDDTDTGHEAHDSDSPAAAGADLEMFSDVSVWEIPVRDYDRIEIIKKGSAFFQNKDGPFTVAVRQTAKAKGDARKLSKQWFYIAMPNGDKILRSWMVYSPVSKSLYCFCCRLFAVRSTEGTSISKFVTGFQNWWKLSPKVYNHETSEDHLRCFEQWKTLEAGLRLGKTIDAENTALMDTHKKQWRDILHRLLDITLYLAKQNLAFRGHKEDESSKNKGNFLEMVKLLSKYDPVLKEHLLRVKQSASKLRVSYLSPQTQNEFISVLANHVKEKLVKDIQSAKFFGIMFDSTPDISHTDQMSEVIRYVKIENREVEVKEVFLGFFPLTGKKAQDLSSDILEKLKTDGLDIMMCRAQGYDNAATMSGIHGGVQAIIKEKNRKAIFNGCIDHSLNLCGQHSFAANAEGVTFFGTLESMYSFFAASTHRWDVLIANTGVTLKRLSTTRWSAHHDAVKPVKENLDKLVEAIQALCDPSENLETRGAANNLLLAICDFTFLCYLYFWCPVLEEVNLAQQYLQTKGLSLDKVVTKLEALRLFLHDRRDHLVQHAVEQALVKSKEHGISVERRTRFKKRMAGEQARDVGLTLQEEIKRAMLECIDRFHCELQTRSSSINEISDMFEAVQGKSLISATEEELQLSVPKLTSVYDEVSESELLVEIPRLRRHLKAAKINAKQAKVYTALDMLKFITEWDFIESLPNVTLSLKLFLTICVSVASCERSFSKLKLIKNYLRSTMGEARLSDLAILSIESELVEGIDFDEVIDRFAAVKARRINF